MKVKYLWILLVTVVFIGCDDNTGQMGLGMLPGSDLMEVKSKDYNIRTRSILSDSVFAKINTGYVGKFTDEEFGYYEASFLTELNCTENFRFPAAYNRETGEGDMAGDSVYNVFFRLTYGPSRFFGDSLNACRMSLYQLNNRLERKFYTSIDPTDYYVEDSLLARRAYTAADQSLSIAYRRDTLRWNHYLNFDMPREFGNKILQLNRKHPEYFADANAFIDNVFKGLYAKADYGDGTILYIDRVELVMQFWAHYKDEEGKILKKKDGTDSLGIGENVFASTKEIIQANRFTNSEKLAEKANDPTCTYIKSPAGIFTQANLPVQDIYNDLRTDTLNSVKMTFTGYAQNSNTDDPFALPPPSNIVLLREKDAYTFFEKNSLADNVTSYTTQYSNSQYTFLNLTNLINHLIVEKEAVMKGEGKDWTDEQWAKWEEETKWSSIVLVPIILNTESGASSSALSIENDMKPGYVKLKGGENGEDLLTVKVEYTEFN